MVTSRKVNAGRNAIRDFLSGEVAALALGTGTTDPKVTDTSLEAEVIEKAATAEDGGKGEVTHTIRVLASEANGETLAELATKASDGTMEDRLVFAGTEKTNNFELEFRLTQTTKNS